MTANYYDYYQKNPVFSNEFYSQFLRTLGKTYAQCADVGECFITLNKIKNNDFNSWYKAWHDLAETVTAMGNESQQAGHNYSAGKAFLRAAEYHRNSEFFLRANLEDPRIIVIYDQLRLCFDKALECLHPGTIKMILPFEHHSLDGYYFTTDLHPKATL
ncbi:MAG: alpha/beta hydrolase, partial [Gammaproteobacteria bacterium]|nr:alpha/beta hydrolase [Gammaproteobacteria bacterium]